MPFLGGGKREGGGRLEGETTVFVGGGLGINPGGTEANPSSSFVLKTERRPPAAAPAPAQEGEEEKASS